MSSDRRVPPGEPLPPRSSGAIPMLEETSDLGVRATDRRPPQRIGPAAEAPPPRSSGANRELQRTTDWSDMGGHATVDAPPRRSGASSQLQRTADWSQTDLAPASTPSGPPRSSGTDPQLQRTADWSGLTPPGRSPVNARSPDGSFRLSPMPTNVDATRKVDPLDEELPPAPIRRPDSLRPVPNRSEAAPPRSSGAAPSTGQTIDLVTLSAELVKPGEEEEAEDWTFEGDE